MGELTHLSLFTGIGGLDLAAEWAGFKTVGQCEFADYPTQVLEKHWPDVPRWKDVREFTGESFRQRTGLETVTVISGGFPCQPHSLAGKRKASSDERDLWPEYRRIISELRPEWVVAENVRGLLSSEDGRFFRGILRDFADLGFDVGWCTYPAAWVGAIHRRERVFTIAHTLRRGLQEPNGIKSSASKAYERSSIQVDSFFAAMGIHKLRDIGDIRKSDVVADWMDRIKSIGNMVDPRQAYPIFQAIAEVQDGTTM